MPHGEFSGSLGLETGCGHDRHHSHGHLDSHGHHHHHHGHSSDGALLHGPELGHGGGDGDEDEEDDICSDVAERKHFNEVLRSFSEYSLHMDLELSRREAHLAKLPASVTARMPSGLPRRCAEARVAVLNNQTFFDALVKEQRENPLADPEPETSAGAGAGSSSGACGAAARALTTSVEHHSKVRSMLHSLSRDWAAEGEPERTACYGPMLAELARLLPVTPANRNRQRVLIPGCGIGRLVWECAMRGYAAQGALCGVAARCLSCHQLS